MAIKRKTKIVWITAAVVLAALVILCGVYLGDYYAADGEAMEVFASEKTVDRIVLEDNTIVCAPEGATAGLIFYPGGKVEHEAYAPLMEACAEAGILCVLVEMPFHLAVFDVEAAEGMQELYPEIEDWYIGGHSLGGSMAAAYLADNADAYEGLILLGSYSAADLSETELEVLSVYGSEDMVLNREKYEEYRINLPGDFTEIIIDGGCHAGFGMYGPQEGDGTPTITTAEQITRTATAIAELVRTKG